MFGKKGDARKTVECLERKRQDIGYQLRMIEVGEYRGPNQIRELYQRAKRLVEVSSQTQALCSETGYHDYAAKAGLIEAEGIGIKRDIERIAKEKKVRLRKLKKRTTY